MEVSREAPAPRLRAPLKPYVDIRTGRSYATRDELDRAMFELTSSASISLPPSDSSAGIVSELGELDVDGDKGDVATTSASVDDEVGPLTPPDAGPAALQLAISLRMKASGAVDEPFICPRCRVFKCSFEPNLEAHLRQCRRRELPAHFKVSHPPSSLFPTPAELREMRKRPASNEGLSSVVKASRIAPNIVSVQTVFAAPPVQQAAPVAPRRAVRLPKEQSMTVPRGGKLTVTSPSGLVFSIRREARSKRFKCPRCLTFGAGNPVTYHEHVDHECTAPWPTVVPSASEPSKQSARGRGRRAAAPALPTPASAAAPLLDLPPPSPLLKRLSDSSEGLPADDLSIDADGEADLAEMGLRKSPQSRPEFDSQPEAGPSGSSHASGSATLVADATTAPSEGSTAQPQPAAGPSSSGVNKRGVPRRSESVRAQSKLISPLKAELSDDDNGEPEYEAAMSEELESEDEEEKPRAAEPKQRKKRVSLVNPDGSKPGQRILQEGEESSWQVTCRICVPALAFINQSVKKVHHRVYHQSMCTIGAAEPGHTIKVHRTDDTFVCPKCKHFSNRDPVSLQTHAKICKALYTGPTEPPPPPIPEGAPKPKRQRTKVPPRVPAVVQVAFDADGKSLVPIESTEGTATASSRPKALDGSAEAKVWICSRCDPPMQLKSESDRAMHYRKTHQMETSITDPAGQVHNVKRDEDGFFRCLRCPGYTSRDSVLARTHIIKSCRFPWPVTPGQVDPNTVEVPAETSSPRETKRRRKDPHGPSSLSTPRGGAGSATATSSKAESTSPADPLSYGAGSSTGLYSQPQATYGQQHDYVSSAESHQQPGYAPLASSQDPYVNQATYIPYPQSSAAPQQAGEVYAPAQALFDASSYHQAAYRPESMAYMAYAAAVGGDQVTQSTNTPPYPATYQAPLGIVPQPVYHSIDLPPPPPPMPPAVASARVQPLGAMATPEVLQSLPSIERVAFARLLEENQHHLALQEDIPPEQ